MEIAELKKETRKVVLPRKRVHEVPRILLADAYTIGANKFQSVKAKQKSVYYITFRRELNMIDSFLYNKGDDRIAFNGLQRILERILYKPVTHEEIDEAVEFLKHAKVTTDGFKEYEFPEHIWREIVDKYNGYPPIRITAMREGSIAYPNEPVIMIESMVDGYGEIAAWFESKLLQVYGATERVTQDRHWLYKLVEIIGMVEPDMPHKDKLFLASLMLTDFSDRAGLNQMESEDLGMAHLYTYGGTDTFSGAYQAWKNSDGTIGIFSSVNALAHRNVQAYENEGDCYKAMYSSCGRYEFLSMVADCYNYRNAVEKHLLVLAKKSADDNDQKIIVARPDSGNALDEIIWTIELAIKNGLYTTKTINGKVFYYGTTLRIIEGDGMTHKVMWDIMIELINRGYAPHGWLLFGVGGGNRNNLKRDNLSAKYALCAIGNDYTPVCKFSDTLGKTTLGGYFKVLRSKEALANKQTVVMSTEDGINALVEYYNGLNSYKPFSEGQDDDFNDNIKRLNEQFENMPLTLKSDTNHNYPASDLVLKTRLELLEKYAPMKDKKNY